MKRIFWIVVLTGIACGVAETASRHLGRTAEHYIDISAGRAMVVVPNDRPIESTDELIGNRYERIGDVLTPTKDQKRYEAMLIGDRYLAWRALAHCVAVFFIPITGLFLAFPVLFWRLLKGIGQGARLLQPLVTKGAYLALGAIQAKRR